MPNLTDTAIPYRYKAEVSRVVDGDTIDVMVDLGCNMFTHRRLRLLRVDTWELRGEHKEKGKAAKEWLERELSVNKALHGHILIETEMDAEGKYGRLLAEIYRADGTNLNDQLIELWSKE